MEEYIDKLIPMSNDVNRLLRLIRFLDKRIDAIQSTLASQQKKFEAKIKDLKDRRAAECPPELRAEYEAILEKQK